MSIAGVLVQEITFRIKRLKKKKKKKILKIKSCIFWPIIYLVLFKN